MYSLSDLQIEAQQYVEAAVDEGRVVEVPWIAKTIIDNWPAIEGPGRDRYEIAAWDTVRGCVRKAINRYKAKPEEDAQLVLPGYRYLQKAYAVHRNGDSCVVSLDQLTDDEILARVAEYQRMADGCMKHAEELMGYYSRRAQTAA